MADTQYQRVMKWVAGIMACAYIAMGAAVLLALGELQHVPATTRLFLGVMMICYGLFRAYRFWVNNYSKKEEEDEA